MSTKAANGKQSPQREKRARIASGDRATVIPDLALWNASSRIGGGITPARISQILRDADLGLMTHLMDLANECRQRDAHLQAVLATSEESIAGLGWQLSLPEDARAKDKRAAKWVESVLRSNPHLHSLIAHLAGAVFYSYAVAEIMWTKDAGKMVPESFTRLAQRRFCFRLKDGKFLWRDEGMGTEGIDFQAEHPRKFIVSQPRVTGDIPSREGLCRTLVWMSVFRNWIISDWLRTAEFSWKPWRIGTYKKSGGTNNEDRVELENAMRRLTTDGALVMADTSTIKVEWPGGSSSTKATHKEAADAFADEMSKAVLGQTETTQSSKSSGYAQAKVHEGVRKDLVESRAKQVAEVLTRDLITPMIELNFDGVRPPTFEFLTQDPVDLKAFSEALANLKKAGARIPQAWVYEQTGIPEPKDGDKLLENASDPNASTNANPDGSAQQQDPAAQAGAKPAADQQPQTTDPAAP